MAALIGVSTFRIGKRRRASWLLDAGSRAPPQPGRKPRLTMAPLRTCQPRSSLCASRRFNQGFTHVQLGPNVSSHQFPLWVPMVFSRLLPA
jgi:hypothetical protein